MGLQVFNRCPMLQTRIAVRNCIERERLEFELLEIRTCWQYLSQLRFPQPRRAGGVGPAERVALARVIDDGLEHGCSG